MGRVENIFIDYSRVEMPPARRIGHRRPFFRRQIVELLCGKGVEPPRGRGRQIGARESQVFFGYIRLMFSKIRLDIIITIITFTTEEHFIIRINYFFDVEPETRGYFFGIIRGVKQTSIPAVL